MGTIAPPGPTPTPQMVLNFYNIMKQVFPGSTSENPEEETHNALDVAVSVFTLRLSGPAATANGAWDAFVAANPSVTSTAPAAIWTRLQVISAAKLACIAAQAMLTAFANEVNEWWANASQTATGTGPNVPAVPAIPATLPAAISAAVAAVAAL